MDDAEAYLQHANTIRRCFFVRGYAVANHGGNGESRRQHNQRVTVGDSTAAFLSGSDRAPRLPMKKRKRNDDDTEVNGTACLPVPTTTTDPSSLTCSHGVSAGAPVLAGARKRLSLIDKCFPGNTLKEGTLDLAQSPPIVFTEATVSRVTQAREQMLELRSDVEDLEGLLTSFGEFENATNGITTHTWKKVRDALLRFTQREVRSLAETQEVVAAVMARKAQLTAPTFCSVKMWHEYLNAAGPEAGNRPSVSLFVWLSSANTTMLFTVLTQRFLKRFREAQKMDVTGSRHEGNPVLVQPQGLWDAEVDDENDSVFDSASEAAEGDTSVPSNTSPLLQNPLTLSPELTEPQRQLLIFLRFFMPTTVVPGVTSTGYGLWLLACLVALDTPLDPDTDRLVHDLFRTCCNQVRVMGEWKGISGEHRGALLEAFSSSIACSTGPGEYRDLDGIHLADVLALYTIIVILAKFFRQNQNRLIPL